MRKELKSKSRRKWLIGGSLAFASVALLTTGFATWVIGVHQTSGDGQVNIGVDTAKDNSVELTFNLEEAKISVAEDAGTLKNSNLTIERDGSEGDIEPDWTIKIKDLNIVVGETFYNSIKDKQDLKIVFALQKDVTEDKNSVTDDMVKVRGEQAGSSWKYIDLVKSKFDVTLPDSYPTDGRIYDINDKSHNPDEKIFSFFWGSYFDGKAPSEFYKGKEENRVVGQSLREYYQKALQELQAMNKALNKGTLKLTATFDYGQQKVGE
ncbi:MAG: hypothetical protein KIB47_04090 [Clostridium sp.]|nr:hypothetical protein [Clostridium sp.]